MGKNWKEKEAYRYLHDVGDVSRRMMITLGLKWRRHNWDVGEERAWLVSKKDEISNQEMLSELEEYEPGWVF